MEPGPSRKSAANWMQGHFHGTHGRKLEREDGSLANFAVQMQLAAVLGHDAEDDGQPQASADAGRLRGKKWVEDARLNGLRNSRAVVADFQEHPLFGDAMGPHADSSALALLFDGLARIPDQVHEHL